MVVALASEREMVLKLAQYVCMSVCMSIHIIKKLFIWGGIHEYRPRYTQNFYEKYDVSLTLYTTKISGSIFMLPQMKFEEHIVLHTFIRLNFRFRAMPS